MSLSERLLYFLARWFGYFLLNLLGATLAIRFHRRDVERRLLREGTFIYAFWHARLLLLSWTHRRQKIHIMISEHRDGELIAQVTRHLGFGAVRGSTTRGGRKALRAMARVLRRYNGAVTPDGPRGPRHVVQPGVIAAAQLSGRPILPVISAAHPRRLLSSWDRFMLPYPFGCAVVAFGEPLYVPRRLSEKEFEERRLELQRRLLALEREADALARAYHLRRRRPSPH